MDSSWIKDVRASILVIAYCLIHNRMRAEKNIIPRVDKRMKRKEAFWKPGTLHFKNQRTSFLETGSYKFSHLKPHSGMSLLLSGKERPLCGPGHPQALLLLPPGLELSPATRHTCCSSWGVPPTPTSCYSSLRFQIKYDFLRGAFPSACCSFSQNLANNTHSIYHNLSYEFIR